MEVLDLICTFGFQSCFGLVFPYYASFLTFIMVMYIMCYCMLNIIAFLFYRALQLRDCLNYNVSDGFNVIIKINLIKRDFELSNSVLIVQEYGDFGSWTI